jgi:hypothetical protein
MYGERARAIVVGAALLLAIAAVPVVILYCTVRAVS